MTSALPPFGGNFQDLVSRIEHTVLQPQSGGRDVVTAATQARDWRVRALVVKPCHVSAAADLLRNSGVLVVTVVGFPHGGQTSEAKAFEARDAVRHGAAEVDMVINVGALTDGNADDVLQDMRAVAASVDGRPLKAIIETAYLTDPLKALASELAARGGVAYVKTSTGFAPEGATVADVALIRSTVGHAIGIKASGGIRTYAAARALLEAGADLIGVSQTATILAQAAAGASPGR